MDQNTPFLLENNTIVYIHGNVCLTPAGSSAPPPPQEFVLMYGLSRSIFLEEDIVRTQAGKGKYLLHFDQRYSNDLDKMR